MIQRTLVALIAAVLAVTVLLLGVSLIGFFQADQRRIGIALVIVAIFGFIWVYDWWTETR